ncbi:unnamed protein product [Ectocarpus sp. 12 AP-2014]
MEGSAEGRQFFMVACLAQKAKKYAMARAAWEQYLAIRPFDPKAYYNHGVCIDALGEKEAALSSFEKAFELQPSLADAGANAAGLLIQTGEAERACTLCYRALDENPDCAVALYNLNTALRMAGRPREAITLSWRWIRERLPADTPIHASAVSLEALAAASSSNNEDGANPRPCAVATTRAELPSFCGSIGGFESEVGKRMVCAEDCSAEGSAAKEHDANGASCVTVVCIRWGPKYGPEYVERLAAGVRRNLRRDHRFVCYTDDVEALSEMPGVVARPLGSARCGEWRGWWHKAFLFSRETTLAGRVVYIDLDTVIADSLDDIAGYAGPFAVLSAEGMANERRPGGLNSSVMSWDAGSEVNTVQPVHDLLKEAYAVVTACVHKFDHWLEMAVPSARTLQRAFPDQIVEYTSLRLAAAAGVNDAEAGNLLLPQLPQGARIVCFPLEPKPHNVNEEWLRQMWLGEQAIG